MLYLQQMQHSTPYQTLFDTGMVLAGDRQESFPSRFMQSKRKAKLPDPLFAILRIANKGTSTNSMSLHKERNQRTCTVRFHFDSRRTPKIVGVSVIVPSHPREVQDSRADELRLYVRTDSEKLARWKAAASRDGQLLSQWVRQRCNDGAAPRRAGAPGIIPGRVSTNFDRDQGKSNALKGGRLENITGVANPSAEMPTAPTQLMRVRVDPISQGIKHINKFSDVRDD